MKLTELKHRAESEWASLTGNGRTVIMVGAATCGRAAGALEIIDTIKATLRENSIEAEILQVGCIGACYLEPIVDIVKPGRPHVFYGRVSARNIPEIILGYLVNDTPQSDYVLGTHGKGTLAGIGSLWDLPMLHSQQRVILRNCGLIDPRNINHYIAGGGYSGLDKALRMKPEEIIDEIKKAGLRGRGGAGFPTATKWALCRKNSGTEKYIVCNADEGDPGAFMNRSLLEGDPHSVLEGMLIGAFAIGARKGYIYCRAEKPLAIERITEAVKQLYENGLAGENILETGVAFDIEVRAGAGAFVCGEETALIASIEGKRGMPMPRPPFPAEKGLWGNPTNINNVETWANVTAILQNGSAWYTGIGSDTSKGTKTFALAGKINHTGLIEVPFGISLRKIITDIGGGVLFDKKFKAVQIGGPSGGCIPADQLDQPIDYESLPKLGAIVGSGGMIVMDEETCMVDIARFFMSFIQSESCGKCVPCRAGTKQMLDILNRITQGKGMPGDIELLTDLAGSIKIGSLCGLGQTSPNPVLTTLRYFRNEYEAHIHEKRCPALACAALTSYYIAMDKCRGCGICARNCSVNAIMGGKNMVHVIDQEKCIRCGTCYTVCPPKFKAVLKVSGEKIEVPDSPIPVAATRKEISLKEDPT